MTTQPTTPAARPCTWPACLTETEHTELAAQVTTEEKGKHRPAMPDQRPICGCNEATRVAGGDAPANETGASVGTTAPAPACGPACAEAHTYQPGCAQCIPGGWVDLLGSDDVHEDPDPTPAETVPCPATVLRQPHPVHEWAPQPGMDLVVCRGYGPATERLRGGRRLPTTPAPVDPALTQRVAEAIRHATCNGDCGSTEEECVQQRIQPMVWHFGRLAEVSGTPEQIAAAVLAELAPELARARQIEELLDIAHETSNRSEAERAHAVERAEQAETALAAGIPLVCSDERHQAKVTALEAQVRRLNDLIDRLGPTEQQQRHRAEQAETALTRVRDLHARSDNRRPLDLSLTPVPHCTGCGEGWPCDTNRALTGPAEENTP